MRRIALACFAFASLVVAHGQTRVDPVTQINWPRATGDGPPSSGACFATVYGLPYTDLTNNNQYVCGGSGWLQVNGAGGSPGGSDLDMQYNHPRGTFAGSNAFTFNGSHGAIGVGSTIDSGPTLSANADGTILSPSAVSLISEDSTQVENGLYLGLTINPSAPTTAAAYGERIDVSTSSTGPQWGSNPEFAALVSNAINTGTGTGADGILQMLNELTSININSGEVAEETGVYSASFNIGSGELDLALGLNGSIVQDGNGIIDAADEIEATFDSPGNASTTTVLNGVHITTPNNNGDEIDTLNGLLIDEQCVDGVVTCDEMNIAGTGKSAFAGPITTPTLPPGTNTTQVATTAFVKAAITAAGGAFSGGLGASYQDVTEIAAPSNPASGNDRLYTNSTTHLLACLTSAGGNCMPTGGGSGTVSSVALTVPSWLTVGGSPITTFGTIGLTPTAAQTSHQVIGTCGSGTTFAPCSLVSGDIPTLNQNTTGSAASLSISGQTGLLSFTGLASTNRIKTVRDAADTLLELGGSYTPTGTWVWTSASVTWPTFNQNTTGNAATANNAVNLSGTGVDYAPYQSASATTGYIVAPVTSGHTFVYAWQPSGAAVAPTAFDITAFLASGTVTSFSSGNLAPLFTTSVATATNTPALSFALSSAAQNSVWAGPATGGAGAPSYQTSPTIAVTNMTGIGGFNISGNAATATLATGATNIAGGVANDVPYQTGVGATNFIAPVNNAVLITSAGGVPSESATLPSGLTIPGYLTSSGVSGMTTGQVPIAATATTITSSIALGTTGSDIPQLSGGLLAASILPKATTSAFGAVEGDASTLTLTSGVISCTTATTSQIGCAKPDGSTITISGGVITAIGSATPNALTMNNSGSGAASGATFNGSAGVTLSYNTLGAAPALGNNVPQTTSFTIVVNTVHRFTGSGASNATTPASVTTGFIASIWNQGTAAVTVVTGGPTLVCVPSTCIVPVGAAASITTDGTNFDVQISNALGSAFGTAANVNTGTSGATIPLLNVANTWGGLQTFGTNFSVGGVTATGATGTGNVVFSISPALTGTPDASGATQFKLPVGASFASAANGETGYDTTNKNWHDWANAVDNLRLILPASGTYTNGHCLQISNAGGVITGTDAGSSCGSDSGGGTSGWSGTPLTFISTTTQYAPPVGGSLTSATESVADVASPVAQTISNLSVSLSGALGASASLQVIFRDGGVSQALTCTTAAGGASCVDSTHSYNVAKGDLIDFQLVSSGTVTAGVPQIVITYAAGTSSVGVTSIATTSPITGGTITSTGTIACATCLVATVNPSAGLLRVAGSTQTATGAELSGDATTSGSNAVTVVKINGGAMPTSAALLASNSSAQPTAVTVGTGVITAAGINGGSAGALGVLIATGTAAMNTSVIASGACATVVTVAGSGIATTDVIEVGFNGDPTAVTGYGASATGAVLTIYPYPSSGNANFKVCNSSASSITPSALTLNWKVYR